MMAQQGVRSNLIRDYPGGGGKENNFLLQGGIFVSEGNPPRGAYEKKLVLRKKNFLPMSYVPHIIMVFPLHNMPLALVGIPLIGYLGY